MHPTNTTSMAQRIYVHLLRYLYTFNYEWVRAKKARCELRHPGQTTCVWSVTIIYSAFSLAPTIQVPCNLEIGLFERKWNRTGSDRTFSANIPYGHFPDTMNKDFRLSPYCKQGTSVVSVPHCSKCTVHWESIWCTYCPRQKNRFVLIRFHTRIRVSHANCRHKNVKCL